MSLSCEHVERSEDVAAIGAPSTDASEGLPLPDLLAANQGNLEQVGLGEKLNLTLKSENCHGAMAEVQYLGPRVGSEKQPLNPQK